MILKFKEGEILVGEMEFLGLVDGNYYGVQITRVGTPITSALGWETKANGDIIWQTESDEPVYMMCRPDQNVSDTYACQTSISVYAGRSLDGASRSHAAVVGEYPRGMCVYWLRNVPPDFQGQFPNGALLFSNAIVTDKDKAENRFDVNSDNNPGYAGFLNYYWFRNFMDTNYLIDKMQGHIDPDPQPEPPKFPGDDNTDDPAGGDGEGPDGLEDDPIEAPEDPGISAVDSGLLTLYTPTLSQVHAFGNYLWSDLFSLDTFKKLFSDPMQAVIGLSVLPVSVPSSGAQNIVIGSVDSGVSANKVAKQFIRKDCGTLSVKPIWNTALDFEPYTKFAIYLPYIGTRELKTDDIMGKDINVSYLIDALSGSCTAHIKVGGSVLYQFSGSCAVPIPITGTSWNNLLTSCIQLAGAGIVTAASGGAASAAIAGGMAAAGTANMVANAKPNIQRTGAVSGAAGMLGVQTPYLIRETPRQSLAKGYNKFVGYPSNITSKLSDLKGFTQVENIHLENLSCTAAEAAEIESQLKEGVII